MDHSLKISKVIHIKVISPDMQEQVLLWRSKLHSYCKTAQIIHRITKNIQVHISREKTTEIKLVLAKRLMSQLCSCSCRELKVQDSLCIFMTSQYGGLRGEGVISLKEYSHRNIFTDISSTQ